MKRLADDLFLLRGFPPFAINVYLMGGVLVDAGTRMAGPRILRQLRDRPVTAHALTHAHPDHQGASREVCSALGLPGLHEPPWFFSADPAENRRSARKVAALEPALVCFGHGPPLRDAGRLATFVERLPA